MLILLENNVHDITRQGAHPSSNCSQNLSFKNENGECKLPDIATQQKNEKILQENGVLMKNHYVPSQSFANHQVVKTRNNDKLTVETNTTNILSKSHETGNFSARASCPNDKCRHESRNIKSTGCSTHRMSASASSGHHPGRSNNISYVYVIFILWYII